MIAHYLKIAFRNMWKFKLQTAISVIGLAVGFTCFALATLWIVYEMSFDIFHKNAKLMYVVYQPNTFSNSGYSKSTGYQLPSHLKETFPEIDDATPLQSSDFAGKVILCSLFNYLTLFVSRFRMRQKELALRMVCGASGRSLLAMLSVVSAVCILICIFGFVSLVSLTCEERRKSIAIQTINGATSGNILAMFAKEYSLLLIIGAAIALSAGYFIMQRWLEQYVKQTSIPAWIYLSIVFVMAFVIVLCVGWQVYKASAENPAEVVKSE